MTTAMQSTAVVIPDGLRGKLIRDLVTSGALT